MNQDIKRLQSKISSFCEERDWDKFHTPKNLAYERKCAVTNSSITETLEAAHIIPYKGSSTNHVQNGILLRADIHTLFDLDLLRIDKNYRINIDESIEDEEYKKLHLKFIRMPNNKESFPSTEALEKRFNNEI